ncbi:GH25 family lysozyme [Paenibacillus sp. R14(2021)]|uniref:GH25 family lysozyme n=1 Tax=Paenibacillus sp. R14(2021) TaxID=2859228 RepID=UPI00215796A0|nr:GH25 family lysozyme [Paenibacillus sp. R14(2021)]
MKNLQARSPSHLKVIDVSHHQGTIDWEKVRSDGVVGTLIKATEGTTYTDPNMAVNADGALKAGLHIGFYHYAHPERNDALSEAAQFVSVIQGRKSEFPHTLDVEGDAANVPSSKLTDWCVQWLKEVERLTGQKTMIYTGASFAKTYLGKKLGQWPLWVAHYGTNKPMDNGIWDTWSVFQYTSSGKVKGIGGNVDINAMEEAFYKQYTAPKIVTPLSDTDTIKVVINDMLAAYGRNVNGSIYAPLRQLGDALGAAITWDTATRTPFVSGKVITNYMLIDSVTYVSVRATGEYLGGTVTWDSKTQKVYIYYKA